MAKVRSPDKGPETVPLREIDFLARQVAHQSPIPAYPSDQWAWHYPESGAVRNERLQGLHQGRYQPADVAGDLEPQALLYNVDDIREHGLEAVSGNLRDLALQAKHYDYRRFAEFVAAMQGKDIDLPTIEALYDGIAQTRVRQQAIETTIGDGGASLKDRIAQECQQIASQFEHTRGLQRVLQALQTDWATEQGYGRRADSDSVQSQLTKKEQQLCSQLQSGYKQFVSTGSQGAYDSLVKQVHEALPNIEAVQNEMSPSMEKLEQELEKFKEKIPKPADPGGPNFPPDAQDLHNQMHELEQGESVEGAPQSAFFDIEPAGSSTTPMTGHFVMARKSRFDSSALTWSNDTVLDSHEYTTSITGDKRQRISGTINTGLKNLPLPSTYALDINSLKIQSGPRPKFYRDQNGCFYVFGEGVCSFSVEFLKEPNPRIGPPTAADLAPLPGGSLSAQTEQFLTGLSGNQRSKAKEILQYIHRQHWYPGGGDSEAARALKLKIKSESTAATYLPNIDRSEYLDCDLADTLGAHLLRRAGVHARLAVGHMVEGTKNGKAEIHGGNGHAWVEFWDGTSWVPVDFTPPPKPEDKKKQNKDGEKSDGPGETPDDGLMDSPPPPEDLANEMQDRVDQQMQQVTDDAAAQAKQNLKESQEKLKKMQEQKDNLDKQVSETDSLDELEKMKEGLEKEDLLEDMKKELQEKIKDKQEKAKQDMKDEIKKMTDDGFMDEARQQELQKKLAEGDMKQLEKIRKQLEQENKLYNEYDEIRREVEPLVNKYYQHFVRKLPKEVDMQTDELNLGRSGRIDRRAIQRPRNVLLGNVKHPHEYRESAKPLFLASILVDVSGSMKDDEKDKMARKLLVFYSELLTRIEKEFGYMRFSIAVFDDTVRTVKSFSQRYDSRQRYDFDDDGKKSQSTVKARLMNIVKARGGTNMLDALKQVSTELNAEKRRCPKHASALYFIGDGEDTCGNAQNITNFMTNTGAEESFGKHLVSATMLGDDHQRQILARIFGEDHTSVAADFDSLVALQMKQFDRDMTWYSRKMGMLGQSA